MKLAFGRKSYFGYGKWTTRNKSSHHLSPLRGCLEVLEETVPQSKFDTAVYGIIGPSSPSVISKYNTKHKISFPRTASSHGKPVFDILCRPVGVAASISQKEKEVTLLC